MKKLQKNTQVRRFPLVAAVATGFALFAVGCLADGSTPDAEETGNEGQPAADVAKIAKTKFTTSSSLTAPGKLTFGGGYVGLTVAIEPTKALRAQLNTALFGNNGKLNDRGSDAHITLLTPQEYGKLGNRADATIAKLAAKLTVSGAWKPACVGVGIAKSNPALQTYYIVVDSPAILAFRRDLAAAVGAFEDPNDPYNPHVTLAFTQRDLFNKDFANGKGKNVASCPLATNLAIQ
jgi:2'-5' RNA ligase superfamily